MAAAQDRVASVTAEEAVGNFDCVPRLGRIVDADKNIYRTTRTGHGALSIT